MLDRPTMNVRVVGATVVVASIFVVIVALGRVDSAVASSDATKRIRSSW